MSGKEMGYNTEDIYFTFDFGNQTLFDTLFFIGFPHTLKTRILLFVGLLPIYILTILVNSFLICTVIFSPQLHTPMYYFLCNLSFIDMFYSSNHDLKMLFDVFTVERRISVTGCLTQMYFGLILGGTEFVLLAVMAYDRFIAICFPLHYTIIMSWRTCKYITVIMWSGNIILSVIPTIGKPFLFCRGNQVNHFVCESVVLLELICGNIVFYELFIFIGSLFSLFLPFVFIVFSYICIIISILNLSSVDSRSKTFSTCASHLIVVFIIYGTCMTTYMRQEKGDSSSVKYVSIIYIIIAPLLNPFIYSLRNKEVKKAFWKMLTRYSVPHSL
ncbi:olfactory receptor 13F1-like [Bufo bufo]|uniref:olfactory receptor 13F1-like n=1 Tax=Bufo bufo TaxID=8384 RepID=UPI001ABE1F47|nr:olfactory receptor 13F1-like [Bufo bufo]